MCRPLTVHYACAHTRIAHTAVCPWRQLALEYAYLGAAVAAEMRGCETGCGRDAGRGGRGMVVRGGCWVCRRRERKWGGVDGGVRD